MSNTPTQLRTGRLSPSSKGIVAHLQQHGRQTFEQLHVIFKEPSAYRHNHDNAHIPNPQWLHQRLNYLRKAEHVARAVSEGVIYFVAAYSAGEILPPHSRRPAAPRHAVHEPVAQPRRVYVMSGETYVPPKPTPCRDGAMDFANCPSIEAGRAQPFIRGKAIYG